VLAIGTDDEFTTAEVWVDATEGEKRAAAARLGSIASLLEDRAAGFRLLPLQQAWDMLKPYWRPGQSLGAVLKTAPPGAAGNALYILQRFDWLGDDDA
jgi:hypothetical protein